MAAASSQEQQKHFPTDPAEVLAINDAHRRYDVGDADLWSADEICGLRPMTYDYKVPTFTPQTWPAARRITQAEYSAEFSARDPLAGRVLHAVNAAGDRPTVIVAGGAAAAPYYETGAAAGDVDFFVVGVDPADRAALWRTADKIVRALRDAARLAPNLFPGQIVASLAQRMCPGLITLTLGLNDRGPRRGYHHGCAAVRKYQIIMRAYPSVSAVIHGFDVGACCVAYDGATAQATTLGAFAQLFRVNLVNPAYRSTTYEKRLVKYFGRYYALGLVHLKTGELAAGVALELPHLVLTPAVVRGNRATGTAGAPPDGNAVSDYDPVQACWCWAGEEMSIYAGASANLAQLAAGREFYSMIRCAEDLLVSGRRYGRDHAGPHELEWLPFEKWIGRPEGGPSFEELLPRAQLDRVLDKSIRGGCARDGRVRLPALAKYLGMTGAEVGRYAESLAALAEANPGRRIDASAALRPFRDEIVRRYEAACRAPIEWWITVDPGRQYTASLNPRVEDPAMWYGEGRVERNPGEVSHDVYVESLLAALESKQLQPDAASVYGSCCAICLAGLPRGVANSVTLSCGHSYHWSRNADPECEGFYRWTREGHTDCPTCRDDFGQDAGSEAGAEGAATNGPVVLVIGWQAAGPRGSSEDGGGGE